MFTTTKFAIAFCAGMAVAGFSTVSHALESLTLYKRDGSPQCDGAQTIYEKLKALVTLLPYTVIDDISQEGKKKRKVIQNMIALSRQGMRKIQDYDGNDVDEYACQVLRDIKSANDKLAVELGLPPGVEPMAR